MFTINWGRNREIFAFNDFPKSFLQKMNFSIYLHLLNNPNLNLVTRESSNIIWIDVKNDTIFAAGFFGQIQHVTLRNFWIKVTVIRCHSSEGLEFQWVLDLL